MSFRRLALTMAVAFASAAALAGTATAGVSLAAAAVGPELAVRGPHFVDRAGRVVVLRGLNVAGDAKVPPFRPITSPALLDPLPRWGMNVIRLLFTWEAFEPEMGRQDASYLDYIAATAAAAWERGIYVVIDFHQDAFSRYSIGGCGEGFPAWAVPPGVPRATPDNGAGCADWGVRMISDPFMHASWGAFHRGERGVRDRYLAMLETVAARLASNPGVVGYEIINEPWGDERTELPALHRDGAAAIRRAQPSAIIFVSPHALASSGSQTRLSKPELGGVAYAPHFYDGSVILLDRWLGNPPDAPFANMRATASAWGVPLFVGELGAPAATVNGAAYVDALYERLNETFASAAQWVYTPGWTPARKDGWNDEDLSVVDDRGQLRANFRVRPYAQKIAGVPLELVVTHGATPAASRVRLRWDHQPATGATELFLPRPELFGTTRVSVVTEGEALACSVEPRHLRCTSSREGVKQVTVTAADGDGGVEEGGGAGAPAGCGCAVGGAAARSPLGGPLAALLLLAAGVLRRLTARRSPATSTAAAAG